MISELEKRVQRYWTQRSHDFGTVRRNELEDETVSYTHLRAHETL